MSIGTANLQAWWQLDEASGQRNDSHTGGIHLTDNNTVLVSSGGSPGGRDCALFVAANDEYLSVADEAAVQFADTDWTVCWWSYLETLATMGVWGKYDLSSTREIQFYQNGATQARAYTYDGVDTFAYWVYGSFHDAAETWYSGMLVFDSAADTLKLYKNGSLLHTDSVEGANPPGVSNSALKLGKSNTYKLNGRLSAFAKWSDAKEAADAVTWHNSGSELLYSSLGGGGGGGGDRERSCCGSAVRTPPLDSPSHPVGGAIGPAGLLLPQDWDKPIVVKEAA